ncbi:MAG: XRE family transcriptional regulator, partial [Proteobacteria bacterium]
MNQFKNAVIDNRRRKLLALLAKSDSDKDFAEQVGLAPAYVSQLKLGNRNIGTKVARKMAEALGKDPDWFDEPDSNAVMLDSNIVAYDDIAELGDGYQSIPLVDIKAGAG